MIGAATVDGVLAQTDAANDKRTKITEVHGRLAQIRREPMILDMGPEF